jgi:6-phosphofructokinase
VLSGGQAAGGHNVIMGLFDMLKTLHPKSKLFGFLAGPHGIYSNNYTEITPEFMNDYRNMGGFDMISKCHQLTEKWDRRTERKLRLFTPFETLGYIPSDHSDCPLLRKISYFEQIANFM